MKKGMFYKAHPVIFDKARELKKIDFRRANFLVNYPCPLKGRLRSTLSLFFSTLKTDEEANVL
jgi:hypothetical protein